ncbi:MAG TPA: proline dehydrogenase family protein [Oligoflexus sp.]|uniref:proline dehydrogenase family protein n=1 Tax=Oligoflexus sp. TaxID=1971216 RepID=UPI002D2B7035|nr:proline dehydrogenase family protein [Oligoflexus sp.]HYX32102.1 proline dehydrogenase family protein [Oligoflexus sp.]
MSKAKRQPETPAAKLDLNNTAIAFASLSDQQLRQAIFLFKVIGSPLVVKLGPTFADLSLKLRLPIQGLIKKTIFSHFCGGETIPDCLPRIEQLGTKSVGTILDFAREGGGQEEDFDLVTKEIIRTIDMAAQHRKLIPFAVFKPTGVASLDLLAKTDRGDVLTIDEQAAFARVKGRFEAICEHAAKKRVRIMIDAEESWIQKTVDTLAMELMARLNQEQAIVSNTIQLYRHDRLDFIKSCLATAQAQNFYLGFKLVRGAYLEKENDHAAEEGRPSPINPTKEATDREYNEALKFCVSNLDRIAFCAGTHNEASVRLLVDLMAQHQIEPHDERIHFAQLLGMSDNISFNLAAAGYLVAKYVPYGTVGELLPYLTRRAQENSSVLGQSSRELDLLNREYARRKTAK